MMNGVSGKIHSIETFATLDGPGVRFVVFFQGCPLRCIYCHNPDTWNPDAGKIINSAALLKEMESCRNFIKGGITLSGGEPLMQPEFCMDLLLRAKDAGFHTALDTAGSLPPAKTRKIIDSADLILLDIKALDSEQCRFITGQDNRNSLATLRHCEDTGKPVWIRHVLVPGLTLIPRHLQALASFLKPFRCIQRIDLLPYHKMGNFKWKAQGINNPLEETREPTQEEIQSAEDIFAL